MQALRAPTMTRPPDSLEDHNRTRSVWLKVAWQAARMAGELLLIAAVLMIAGHLLGSWLGVKNPADPRTPGGPTPADIEAFVAAGAVILGLVVSGWRVVHGSMAIFAGALVFGITLPDLVPMAVIFAGIGAINFGAWLAGRIKEFRRQVDVPPLEGQHQRYIRRERDRPRHVAGLS